MRRKTVLNFLYAFVLMFAMACAVITPGPHGTVTQIASSPTATPGMVPTDEALPMPTQPSQPDLQFIAYIRDGQLLVTDVTNGVQAGTTQYTMTGESDQVSDIVWAPSGELVAFVSTATGEPHIFYIYALGQSSPTDLGPGSAPAWSPDSRSIAYIGGAFPDDNIWITTIDNPAPRQLTLETNHAWGAPVFTPDGQSLVVAGADRDYMGVSGNTSFTLEYLALDGSGTRTPLPGTTPIEGARLPYDLRFSPDGTKLSFSTSFHLSACAAPGAYYVSNVDGSNRQEIISPSLKAAIVPNQEHYHIALGYVWKPTGDALVAVGSVVDCNPNSAAMGQAIAGPQLSVIGLDESERTIIPGFFYGLSMDRSGAMIAAAHYQGGFEDPNPVIELYSAQTGQLALTLGPGSNPQFQP